MRQAMRLIFRTPATMAVVAVSAVLAVVLPGPWSGVVIAVSPVILAGMVSRQTRPVDGATEGE